MSPAKSRDAVLATRGSPKPANGGDTCPCGSANPYDGCCGRLLDSGASAPTAEALMRSRYTAYALRREDYLLKTWHPSTRPAGLGLDDGSGTRWIGLEVKRHEVQDDTHATVEFVARFKVNGRAHRMHEISRFLFSDARWFYVDGSTPESASTHNPPGVKHPLAALPHRSMQR